MPDIKVLCAACLQDVRVCKCPDLPEAEDPGFLWNRIGEEVMRFLRLWNLIR